MPCEKYQAALIDLATRDAQPGGDIREHLATCVLCQAFLKQEQQLGASIDIGLRSVANAAVPAQFLQRFEARLAQETPVSRSRNDNWMYLAAAAALILLVLPMLPTPSANEPVASSSPPAQVAKQPPPDVNPPAQPLQTACALPQERHPRKQTPRQQSSSTSQPEVLVPPEEREAFARFLSDLNAQQDLAVALVKPVAAEHERATEPVQTPEIQIAALAVQPLEDRDEK